MLQRSIDLREIAEFGDKSLGGLSMIRNPFNITNSHLIYCRQNIDYNSFKDKHKTTLGVCNLTI